jgi:hypothetical protein
MDMLQFLAWKKYIELLVLAQNQRQHYLGTEDTIYDVLANTHDTNNGASPTVPSAKDIIKRTPEHYSLKIDSSKYAQDYSIYIGDSKRRDR